MIRAIRYDFLLTQSLICFSVSLICKIWPPRAGGGGSGGGQTGQLAPVSMPMQNVKK